MRRLIGSRAHGMIDYPTSSLMMATPWLFRMDRKEIATWLPLAIGASATVYSLLTDYELSVERRLPLKTHLILDAVSGAMLAAAPLLFRSSRRAWIPHVAIGLFEIVTSLMTRPTPEDRESTSRRRSRSRRTSSKSSGSNGSGSQSSNGSTSQRSSSRSSSSRSSSSSRGSSGRRSSTTTDRGSRSRSTSSRRTPVVA